MMQYIQEGGAGGEGGNGSAGCMGGGRSVEACSLKPAVTRSGYAARHGLKIAGHAPANNFVSTAVLSIHLFQI
jgi:hypothetical protein